MNDVINPKTGNCIWYHTTTFDRIRSIAEGGLKPGSQPTWQSSPEPWVYLSTIPWNDVGGDWIVLEVDLSTFEKTDVGWAFADENTPEEELWQLRCLKTIPPEAIMLRGL